MKRKTEKIVETTKREWLGNFMIIFVILASFALSLYITYTFHRTLDVGYVKVIAGLHSGEKVTDATLLYSRIFTGLYYIFLFIISLGNAIVIAGRHEMY